MRLWKGWQGEDEVKQGDGSSSSAKGTAFLFPDAFLVAAAMAMEEMRKVMVWSYKQCPTGTPKRLTAQAENDGTVDATEVQVVGEHLLIRAYTASGFTLWTRNFELTKLRREGRDGSGEESKT
ncbi:hypothetical protein BV22DRAFT_1134551 [Leucogyrophana mollusca]|uniref:Uncharacterized protein n=1 Tax=Leucogyrophana mollusca TaxID=85980 RepID=A0ACB8AYY5_9AGAM|nr:hypothetical protein BV22DRAFT_1134551 [Leucogyrophana mollusca]